jgi:DDE superfamily endonuclease
VIEERRQFEVWLSKVDPARVKVVDETGIVRGMRLAYGYAPRGQRVPDTAPVGRGKRLNILGWMSLEGEICLAEWRETVDTRVFTHFIERYMLPKLKRGDVVVWDNARFHQNVDLEKKLRRREITLVRLPRYSPEYNPIEKLWQKLKHYLKKARIDQFSELHDGLMMALEHVTCRDIEGWYQSCKFKVATN